MSSRPQKSKVGTTDRQKKPLVTRHSSFGLTQNVKKDESFKLETKGNSMFKNYVPEKKGKQNKAKAYSRPQAAQGDAATNTGKPQYDKVATQKFDDMLDGDLTDLPPMPKTMVKIFLSSTFSDMRAERNILARQVYPVLQDFCSECGLDFQVVDMRWGITEDSQNDHSVENLCLLEVKNCQKASIGPNFVVLSGDRYGFRPVPTQIDIEEFKALRSEASRLEMGNQGLLDEWYKLDTNSIPNMYLLQPIRSKFTFFADFSPGCDEPRKRDTAEWWKTFEALQGVLRACADEAHKRNKLTVEQRHQYFCSVTECEIQEGILKASDVNNHCLVYKRELTYLSGDALLEENASRFVDVVRTSTGCKRDEEASKLRENLITKTIPDKLANKKIKFYPVVWKPGGVDPDTHPEHVTYLKKFCEDFTADCKQLISQALEEKKNLIMMSNYYSSHEDTIHHLRFCQSKCESFCGQEQVIEAAKSYILDESNRSPLVIHGQSGAGKTSITAMIMKSIPVWLKKASHIKLIRFLGTSPQSNNIYEVLLSVVGQLADANDMIMPPVSYRNMKSLVEFLPRYLRQVANKAKEPIVILLDSIDQLMPTSGAYNMEWLPTILPTNVKWIISTITQHQDIMHNLKRRLPDDKCYVHVPVLPEATGKLIIETYLKQNKRTVTETQMKMLLTIFKQSPSPLFLKLLVDEARKWKSYTSTSEVLLATTVKEAINKLFVNLENKFGSLLVSRALGYITVGVMGLTEFEIEDVLSCDDDVLNEVYKYHDPPIPGIVRIPQVLWARIRYDIQEYLVERISFGRTTLFWYHRQFFETARERYTNDGKDIILHKNLTEIYLQDNGVKRTIVLKHRKNLTVTDANREVRPLPFTTQNRRKLVCLPYHAMKAQTALGKDMVKSKVFCNFKFLTTKIAAFSVKDVVRNLTDFNTENEDDEISLLLNFLTVSQNDLTYPLRLAVCLLSNINPAQSHTNLTGLQNDARQYLLQQKKPILIPHFPCLAPRKNLSSALNTAVKDVNAILSSSSDVLFLQNQKSEDTEEGRSEYSIFDASTQDVQQIDLPSQSKSIYPDCYAIDRDSIYFTTKASMIKYRHKTGKTVVKKFSDMIPTWTDKDVVVCFALSPDWSLGMLVFRSYIVILDLGKMVYKQKCVSKTKTAAFENAIFMSAGGDMKVVAVGAVNNSEPGDKPQGPANQKFVSLFSIDTETPEAFLPTDENFSSEVLALAGSQSKWLVSYAKGENNLTKLQMFELLPLSNATQFEISGSVEMIQGDPGNPHVAALTSDGVFYVVDASNKKIIIEVKLNHAICTFDVLWEDQISFLASVSGAVTLYDIQQNKNLGAFSASSDKLMKIKLCDQQLVTLDKLNELKSWTVQTLFFDIKNKGEGKTKESSETEELLDQATVTFIGVANDGHELYTCTKEGYLKIWDLDSLKLLRNYNLGIIASDLIVFSDATLALLDTSISQLVIIDPETGKHEMEKDSLPSSVVAMTTNTERNILYVAGSQKTDHLQIDVINMQFMKIAKTIVLQKAIHYTSVEIALSAKERYLILRTGVSDQEYESIRALTKKTGSFGEQPHRWKFTAIDLSQGNGGLIPCFRQLSKIPTLGTVMSPHVGNIMLLCTRRWVVHWDIPTGKCDQKVCKTEKKAGMFYRPSWLGQECKGTSYGLMKAPNGTFLAVGSEDGYLFIYDAETGMPRRNTKPDNKHNSGVQVVSISPDSEWVASSCQGSVLKLWDSQHGKEQFSFRLDSPVQRMMFTPDSSKLVLYTGTHTTRVLIFSVHK